MLNPWLIYFNISRSLRRLKWDKKQLRKYQNRKIREVVQNAFDNSQFYHRLLREAKIYPSDIKNVDDLNRIPIVKKSDWKKSSVNKVISSKADMKKLRKITTGGSTGQPISVFIDQKEDAWRKAIYLRANIVAGQRIRDRWVTIIDAQYSNSLNRLQKWLGFYPRQIVPITLDRSLRFKIVRDMRPDVLDGFPSALHLLAKDFERNGGETIQPRIVFGSGELIDKDAISYLEKTFCAPYFDQFGCTEIDRSAWQCSNHEGYHMDVDSVIMQFVDEDGGEVGSNERGEIVYTSLFNKSFPIIRYNIEDVGVPIDDDCSCGISLPLMKIVEGRHNSFLVFNDDKIVTPIEFIEKLGAFKMEKEVEQYRVIQEKADCTRILLKKASKNVDEESVRRVLIKNLCRAYPDVIGSEKAEFPFEIEFVDEIPLSLRGKLNVVSSNVKPNGW